MDASHPVVAWIREQLHEAGTEEIRLSSQRFFKEPILSHGCKAVDARRIAKAAIRRLGPVSKADAFAVCEELWRSGYVEEGVMAAEWAFTRHKEFVSTDFARMEGWLDRYVHNWATCDTLCNHPFGFLVETFPEKAQELVNWTGSANRWKRRGAAVSLILPARKGLFLDEIFTIAERLLADTDDLVQKGYGWMLKAASQAHPDPVFQYLVERRSVMPRTAFRYALEKFPPERRKEAMGRVPVAASSAKAQTARKQGTVRAKTKGKKPS